MGHPGWHGWGNESVNEGDYENTPMIQTKFGSYVDLSGDCKRSLIISAILAVVSAIVA